MAWKEQGHGSYKHGNMQPAAGAVIASETNHTGLWGLDRQTFRSSQGLTPTLRGRHDGNLAEMREDVATEA